MMIGETQRYHNQFSPWPSDQSLQIPSSPTTTPSTASPDHSPLSPATVLRYLLTSTNNEGGDFSSNEGDFYFPSEDDDDFFMYDFKVKPCTRSRAHDWTECPFAHPGEKARRRDPRRYSYSGTACSDFRKGGCRKGDSCEFAHGVFECWLHPARFRTQACKDGPGCTRRVCFFAHRPDQLRVGSVGSSGSLGSGPNSPGSVDSGLVSMLRSLQLSKVKSMPRSSNWAGSPIAGSGRVGFFSLPTTPTQPRIGYGFGDEEEEEPVVERVESGREVRARMFEKLSKENPLNGSGFGLGSVESSVSGPDLGWVSDLVT